MSAPRVFVSHSHQDDAFTYQLVRDLKAAGADVWVDIADLNNGDFLGRINEALGSRDYLVLVLTQHAVSSPFVQMEVNAALNLVYLESMSAVVPVLAGPCDPRAIPPLWTTLHRYDATREYPSALSGVLRAIGLVADPPATYHPAPHIQQSLAAGTQLYHPAANAGDTLGVKRGKWENYNPPPGPDGPAYQDFWMELVPDLRRRGLRYTPGTLDFASYCEFGAGHRDCLYVAAFTGRQQARVSFDIHRKDNKALFDALSRRRSEIEPRYFGSLVWDRIDGKYISRIGAYYPSEITIHSSRAELHRLVTWMSDHLLALQHALDPSLVQVDH